MEMLTLDSPAPGQTLEVAPGLHWIRMPLPFRPGHVNCWLIEDGDGWFVIDAGLKHPVCIEAWETIFATTMRGRPITRLMVTHFHIDHIGLAGWLCDRFGAQLVMARAEYLQARTLWLEDSDKLREMQRKLGRSAGAPAAYDEWLARRPPFFHPDVSGIPDSYLPILAGDVLRIGGRDWQVMIGQGHSPEMATLHCPSLGLLIAADQILPRISPFIGLLPSEIDANPLRRFLESNQDYLTLPERTLVLPSHGEPFRGLHDRIGQLEAHHAERLDTLTTACATPVTGFEASRILFPHINVLEQYLFTLGESLAHLNYLIAEGRVTRTPGADGLPRYQQA